MNFASTRRSCAWSGCTTPRRPRAAMRPASLLHSRARLASASPGATSSIPSFTKSTPTARTGRSSRPRFPAMFRAPRPRFFPRGRPVDLIQDDPAFAQYRMDALPHVAAGHPRDHPVVARRPPSGGRSGDLRRGARATEARDALDVRWEPAPVSTGLVAALDGEPAVATAAWYHASEDTRTQAVPELVARAAAHPDAHFASTRSRASPPPSAIPSNGTCTSGRGVARRVVVDPAATRRSSGLRAAPRISERLLPERFAMYAAVSARRMSVCGSSSGCTTATPNSR